MTDVCLFAFAESGNLAVAGIPQKFVAEGDGVINAVVGVGYPGVVYVPGQISQSFYVIPFEPGGCDFFRAAFLHVEVATHVVVPAIARQIRVTAALFLAGNDIGCIQFCKYRFVVCGSGVDVAGGGFLVWELVEVADTGS